MCRLKAFCEQVLSPVMVITYLKSVLSEEGKCWSEFYKYVRRGKGNRENIPAIKDCNRRIITDPGGKANSLNCCFTTIFSSEDSIPLIQEGDTTNPFNIDIKTLRRRVGSIGKHKSVGPDRIPGEILKMDGEASILYLERLLEMTINNGTLPADWRRATVVPIHKGGHRSLASN